MSLSLLTMLIALLFTTYRMRAMTEALDILTNASLWAAVLRIATPLIFGVLGALLCERAGVLNLGIEGIMTMGAMVGWLTVYMGAGSVDRACWSRRSAGLLLGLLHAMLTVPLGLSQHVSGLGITLFASALAYYLYRLIGAGGRSAADDPAVPAAVDSRPVATAVPGRGGVQPDRADLSGAGAGRRLPHGFWRARRWASRSG